MATLMNGDPTEEPKRRPGRPLGSKDSVPRKRPAPRPKKDGE